MLLAASCVVVTAGTCLFVVAGRSTWRAAAALHAATDELAVVRRGLTPLGERAAGLAARSRARGHR